MYDHARLEHGGTHDANETDHRWAWTLPSFRWGTATAGSKSRAKTAGNDCVSIWDRQENIHGAQRQASTQRSGHVIDDSEAKGQLQHRPRYW